MGLNRSIYWLVLWNMAGLWLSICWECHHPNWRTHMFQRGRSTCWNHQPVVLLTYTKPGFGCHMFIPNWEGNIWRTSQRAVITAKISPCERCLNTAPGLEKRLRSTTTSWREVLIGKSSINGPVSMAMLNNQRVKLSVNSQLLIT